MTASPYSVDVVHPKTGRRYRTLPVDPDWSLESLVGQAVLQKSVEYLGEAFTISRSPSSSEALRPPGDTSFEFIEIVESSANPIVQLQRDVDGTHRRAIHPGSLTYFDLATARWRELEITIDERSYIVLDFQDGAFRVQRAIEE